jgi:hypothetical protein
MKKPTIPAPTGLDEPTARVLRPVKLILDDITGARSGELARLPADATLPQAVAKINDIISRLNGSGA